MESEADRYDTFANELFSLCIRIQQQPSAFFHLSDFVTNQLVKVMPLAGDSFAVANSLVEIAEEKYDSMERLLGYRLFLAFASYAMANSADREEKGRLLALKERLEQHQDLNVQALILSNPDSFKESVEQDDSDSDSD